ncbi:MAG: xanthine dehydrogenase family protein subunit M [Tepidanaerobacteraceae bacterium]|nr:xanthine dehydrogenase family protein subunit M [Tepidanaerobacteraceae bacterium]
MAEKVFLKAKDVNEIIELKSKYGQKAKVIAGGTDVMVRVNTLVETPDCFLYIGEAGLNYIKEENDNIIIGAATKLNDIIASPLIKKHLPLLVEAVSGMASVAVRNMGTIGGNICNASPAADTVPALLALEASVIIVSKDSQRTVAMKEFFTGPGKTVLNPDEIVKEIIIPKNDNLKWAYKKIGRRKADTLSVISVAVTMNLKDDVCKDAKIALGAVAPTPILALNASALLCDKKVDSLLVDKVANEVEKEIAPIDDQRGSAWYRRRMSKIIVKNLIEQILGKGMK